jgi:hypothetical protein
MGPIKERDVVGSLLTSTYLPPIRIQVDPAFHYLGKLQFTLYNVAQVEVFVFVVADRQHATRVLLFDFEGYLEDNTYTYEYPTTATVNLGGQEYLADAWLLTDELLAQQRPDSDVIQIFTFIQQQGYTLPNTAMVQRFVRLVDAAKRNELLVFYIEALASLGVSEAERSAEELAPAQRERITQAVGERAIASFRVVSA